MMVTIGNDNVIKIGKDFVDCVAGKTASHGEATIGKKTYEWKSTCPIAETETAIRKSAAKEGKPVTYFRSQAV